MAEPQHVFAEGDPIWYQPSEFGRSYAGIVNSGPHPVDGTYSLREMGADYGIDAHGQPCKTYVPAASPSRMFHRVVRKTCGNAGCLSDAANNHESSADIREDVTDDCTCGSGALHGALRLASHDRDGWRKSFEQLAELARAVESAYEDAGEVPEDEEHPVAHEIRRMHAFLKLVPG